MTDVRTWTEQFLRTARDGDQEGRSKLRRRAIFYLDDEHFSHDSGPSSSPVRLKAQVIKGSTNNGDSTSFNDVNSREDIYFCSLNEASIFGVNMDDFPEAIRNNKTSTSADSQRVLSDTDIHSNKDASLADLQSILSDSEIDRLFAAASFLDSSNSSLSGSSSSEEYSDESDLPFDSLSFEDRHEVHGMHSDWDSGLSSNNNSHDDDEWSVAISILENFAQLENNRAGRRREEEAPPLYPHRALMSHDCQVCLTRTLLRRRVCCDFHICAECMSSYITVKVNEAKVQIECPNDRCSVLVHRDEVNERLPKDMKDKFAKFLINANTDPYKKTCPACSEVCSIEPKMLSVKKKQLKQGLKVQCPQCNLQWCYLCQAPFHTEMTCKQYRKGDKMVKQWAKELSAGQSNAQKCPKCKIFIQKANGCDHMKCSKCNTDFCYRCGDRYISFKLLGNHWSKFSLFGCKYRLMPRRPHLRRLIRGVNFAARLLAGVVLAGLGIAAGAILVGASVVIVPGYGLFRLRRHLHVKEKRKREMGRHPIDRFAEGEMSRVLMLQTPGLATLNTQTEAENQDAHRVQVMVHRSVSFSHEDAESEQNVQEENFDFYINKYTTEGTDMVVSNIGTNDPDQVITFTEVTEVQNGTGYPTVVAHIVSKMASDKDGSFKTKFSGKNKKGNIINEPNVTVDLCDNSLLKTDNQSSFCEDKDNDNDGVLKEMSLTESFLRKSMASSVDIPSRSWENLTGNGRVDSGYGDDYESNEDVTISEPKPGSVEASTDTDGTKRGSNGCFGNIFSRRVQASLAGLELPTNAKTQMPTSRKKSHSQKAATWEKSHRDYMKSLIKSYPLDPVKDFNNLTLIMQKSPVSSVDVADIFNRDVKNTKTDISCQRQESALESSPSIDMSDVLSWCATSQDSLSTSHRSFISDEKDLSDDEDNGFIKYSKNIESSRYFSSDDHHVSFYSEVTHL